MGHNVAIRVFWLQFMTNKPVTDNLCQSCSCCAEEGSICAAHTSLLLHDSLKTMICTDLPSGRVVGHKNIIEENSTMNIIYAKDIHLY